MVKWIVWRSAAVAATLVPFVVLQGAADLAPAWLATKLVGIPSTVWLGLLGFVVFVGLIWIFAGEGNDSDRTAS